MYIFQSQMISVELTNIWYIKIVVPQIFLVSWNNKGNKILSHKKLCWVDQYCQNTMIYWATEIFWWADQYVFILSHGNFYWADQYCKGLGVLDHRELCWVDQYCQNTMKYWATEVFLVSAVFVLSHRDFYWVDQYCWSKEYWVTKIDQYVSTTPKFFNKYLATDDFCGAS